MKLKPCPFCGDTRQLSHSSTIFMDDNTFFVVCNMCCAEGPTGADKELAIEAWNRRAEPQDEV